MPQSHVQVWRHIVFSTKDRREFPNNESFRDETFRLLAHHVKERGCLSASVGGHVDHVHLLVGLSRTITIAELVEHVKTETSKWAKKAPEGNTYGIEIRANCRAVGPNAYSCPITQPFGLGYANVWAVGPENRRVNSLLYRAEGPKIRIRPGLATALITIGPVSGSTRPETRLHAFAWVSHR